MSSPKLVKNIEYKVTAEAPINIAVIKYWGKQDSTENIPLNDSISLTLDIDCMKSETTISFNESLKEDRLMLNNKQYPINSRMQRVIKFVRNLKKQMEKQQQTLLPSQSWILDSKVEIISNNNFPTAAGLASSASGYAAVAKALYYLYFEQFQKNKSNNKNNAIISHIARLGSGSACRSIDGGFVKWIQNPNAKESKYSHAIQLFDENYWSDLRVVICVASSKEKKVGSTNGQELTKETSMLMKQRLINVAARVPLIEKAIKDRDFDSFAEITMRDSNDMHSVCLDTFPPIFYLNDTSKLVIYFVHFINEYLRNQDSNKNGDNNKYFVGYTFDAGPNAVLFCKNSYYMNLIIQCLRFIFDKNHNKNGNIEEKSNDSGNNEFLYDPLSLFNESMQESNNPYNISNDETLIKQLNDQFVGAVESQGIEKLIVTRGGMGARVVPCKL